MSDGVQLPQANNLETILSTIQAVADGSISPAEIAERLGMVERQGAYYRDAADLLGLISIGDTGNVRVTDRGLRVLGARDQLQQRNRLRFALRKVEGICLLLDLLRCSGGQRSLAQLESHLQSHSSLSHSTVARRLSTLLAWMEVVGWIRVNNDQITLTEAL